MSLGRLRILSNFSLNYGFSVSRFSFDNVVLQIRHFSVKPRFNFGLMREPNDAIALFQEMVRMQPLPPVIHFTELLSAVIEMKQYSLAFQLFDELLQWDVSIRKNHSLSIPMDLFHKMGRLRPSVIDYTKFLNALVKIKQYSVALHLFDQMRSMDAPVNDYTLTIAINCFCSLKRADFGFAMLGIFFKLGREPNVVTFNTLMKGLILVGKTPEAANLMEKLLAEQARQVTPDLTTYNTLLDGLCGSGCIAEAFSLLRNMEEKGIIPDIVTYNTLMLGLCNDKQVDRAEKFFEKLPYKGLHPNVVTYNILIEGLCNDKQVDKAKGVFEELPSKGARPSVVTYSILIGAVCKQGRMEEAKNLLHQMENKGVQPNVVTYSILIGAFCEQGQMEEAKELLLQMANKSCLPDSVTYNVLLRGLLKRNKLHDAGVYLEEMCTKGFTVDGYTLSMLMESQDAAFLDKVEKIV